MSAARHHVASMLSLSRNLSSQSRFLRIRCSAPLHSHLRPTARAPRTPIQFASFHRQHPRRQSVAQEQESNHAGTNADTPSPPARFSELKDQGIIYGPIIDVLTRDLGFDNLTEVQSRTVHECLSGQDVIAQAKTGTGKTMAFLLPIFQTLIQQDPSLTSRRSMYNSSSHDIRAIIISPTRELAEQIAVEARKIGRPTGIIVQTAVGGTQKRQALRQMQTQGCHILVATPGRLLDLLSDDLSGVSAPKLGFLVMDEADRLLDTGFQRELQQITDLLPDPQRNPRQQLMFSATVPREVVSLVRRTLRPGFHFVKCVPDDDVPTHERVPQKFVRTLGLENNLPALYELCLREISARRDSETPFKAIVYFNGTADVQLATGVFENLGGFGRHPLAPAQLYHISSRLNQSQRTRATESFRRAKSGILFSSDVTARGMDFPNVTHVIQIGSPRQTDSYIHRIGRTGRAGKEGEGWLIAPEIEVRNLRQCLTGLPIKADNSLFTAKVDMSRPEAISEEARPVIEDIKKACTGVPKSDFADTYLSSLNTLATMNKQDKVDALNRLAIHCWGLSEPPAISANSIQKLGLSRLNGLNVRQGRSFGQSSAFGDDSRDSGRFGHDPSSPFSSSSRNAYRGRESFSRGREPFGNRGGFGNFRNDRSSGERRRRDFESPF